MSAAESVLSKAEENDNVKRVPVDLVRNTEQHETTSAVESQTISINTLPERVLLMIFSNLRKAADRCAVARTCRLWNRVMKDAALWKRFRLVTNTMNGFPTVKKFVSCGLSLHLLQMELLVTSAPCNFHDKPNFWRSFQNLQVLKISDIDLSLFDFVLLPSFLTHLQILLPEEHDDRFSSSQYFRLPWVKRVKCSGPVLPNLLVFDIEDRRTKFERRKGDIQELHGLHHLLSSDKLNHVNIMLLHYDFTEEGLSEIGKELINVRYVCFHSQSSFFKLSKTLFAPLKNVEELHLKCFTAEAIDAEIAAILSCLSGLKTLQNVNMLLPFDVKEEHHNTLKKELPKLRVINTFRLEWDRTDPPAPRSSVRYLRYSDNPSRYEYYMRLQIHPRPGKR